MEKKKKRKKKQNWAILEKFSMDLVVVIVVNLHSEDWASGDWWGSSREVLRQRRSESLPEILWKVFSWQFIWHVSPDHWVKTLIWHRQAPSLLLQNFPLQWFLLQSRWRKLSCASSGSAARSLSWCPKRTSPGYALVVGRAGPCRGCRGPHRGGGHGVGVSPRLPMLRVQEVMFPPPLRLITLQWSCSSAWEKHNSQLNIASSVLLDRGLGMCVCVGMIECKSWERL